MRKGTNPIFEFTLPFSTDLVAKAKLTIKQAGSVKLKKYANTADFSGNVIKVGLTQEETFLFDNNSYIELQIRVLTTSGVPLVSDVYRVFAAECLDDEVLKL